MLSWSFDEYAFERLAAAIAGAKYDVDKRRLGLYVAKLERNQVKQLNCSTYSSSKLNSILRRDHSHVAHQCSKNLLACRLTLINNGVPVIIAFHCYAYHIWMVIGFHTLRSEVNWTGWYYGGNHQPVMMLDWHWHSVLVRAVMLALILNSDIRSI